MKEGRVTLLNTRAHAHAHTHTCRHDRGVTLQKKWWWIYPLL